MPDVRSHPRSEKPRDVWSERALLLVEDPGDKTLISLEFSRIPCLVSLSKGASTVCDRFVTRGDVCKADSTKAEVERRPVICGEPVSTRPALGPNLCALIHGRPDKSSWPRCGLLRADPGEEMVLAANDSRRSGEPLEECEHVVRVAKIAAVIRAAIFLTAVVERGYRHGCPSLPPAGFQGVGHNSVIDSLGRVPGVMKRGRHRLESRHAMPRECCQQDSEGHRVMGGEEDAEKRSGPVGKPRAHQRADIHHAVVISGQVAFGHDSVEGRKSPSLRGIDIVPTPPPFEGDQVGKYAVSSRAYVVARSINDPRKFSG